MASFLLREGCGVHSILSPPLWKCPRWENLGGDEIFLRIVPSRQFASTALHSNAVGDMAGNACPCLSARGWRPHSYARGDLHELEPVLDLLPEGVALGLGPAILRTPDTPTERACSLSPVPCILSKSSAPTPPERMNIYVGVPVSKRKNRNNPVGSGSGIRRQMNDEPFLHIGGTQRNGLRSVSRQIVSQEVRSERCKWRCVIRSFHGDSWHAVHRFFHRSRRNAGSTTNRLRSKDRAPILGARCVRRNKLPLAHWNSPDPAATLAQAERRPIVLLLPWHGIGGGLWCTAL